MNVTPGKLVFQDVRLNQSDTKTLTITNSMSVEASFTLRPSSSRYTIVPTGTFRLGPRESIVVSVRLLVDSYSNTQKGINGQEDSIMIKLPYDTQKIPVTFYLHNQYVRSRSPSPVGRVAAVKKVAERSETSDMVNTLHEQVRHKDIRIKELEAILGNVKSKYPGFEEIVDGRVREVQAGFEEKAKKFLDIVREKDALVTSLEEERNHYRSTSEMYNDLTRHDVSEQLRSEGHSHSYWSGRALPGQATGLGTTHQQLAAMLEQTQKQLESEKQAHYQSRTELNEAHAQIEDLTRTREHSSAGRWQLQERKELSGLREQNLDQAEEIKAMTRELEKLRKEASEHRGLSEDLDHAQREVRRLRDDLSHAQQKFKQLEDSHAALQDAHEALEHLSGDLQQRLVIEQQKAQSHAQHQSREARGELRGDPRGARASSSSSERHGDARVSWHEQADRRDESVHVDGMRFEESVGGGVATSTPMHYSLHPSGTAQKAIHEKNAALSLYEDRMSRYEEEIQHLKDRVSEGQKTETALRDCLQEVENQLQGRDQEGRLLSERVERLKSEKEATAHEAQDKEVMLRSALERVSLHDNASTVNDAHLWWAYIWHAMKQQQDSGAFLYTSPSTTAAPKSDSHFVTEVGSGGGVAGQPQPGSMEYKPPHDAAAAVHEARLRDNLRSQAIEITQLRQELIGRKLTFKKEMDTIKDQNEHFQREIVRLQAQTRIHRADKDLKIEQLTAQVRTLSVRGDMHAQAAAALQQVETEKLTNHQLRADLDSYRLMLEEEQRKVLQGRKDCATLQAQIDSSLVLQSVVNVPGVSPATLIELMAGQITQLESEASKSRSSAEEATQQLRALQRTVNMTQQRRQGVNDGNSSASITGARGSQVPGSARARSLSPAGGRRASTGGSAGGLRSNDPAGLRRSLSNLNIASPRSLNNDLNEDMDEGEYGFSPGGTWPNTPFSVVVDGEATPKMVVDSLDRAVLAQRVASQEAAIAELHDLVDDLKAAAMQADRDHLVAADTAEETDRIEWERSKRKQDLLQTLLDESKTEVKKLQQRNLELEKSLSDIHATRMVAGFNTRPRSNVGVVAADNQSVFYEEAPLMGNHTSDMGSFANQEVNFEENKKELESTKILLRERTTQLKVVMETLDSLQLAGVKSGSGSKFHAEDEYLFSRRPGGNADSANSSHNQDDFGYGSSANYGTTGPTARGLSSMENTWGMQALIKRVVELTTELSSQCAQASLSARKAEDLELMCRRQAKEINHFKMHNRTLEDSASRATLQLNSLCSQLQEGDRNHIDAVAGLRSENEKLMTALRETEAALSASEIKITALTQQASITDQSDFMAWLEFVTLDNQKIVTDTVGSGAGSPAHRVRPDSLGSASPDSVDKVLFANKPIGESSVRDLVVSLVLQWKEYVGTVPQMKPLTTPAAGIAKLSKAEQRFLQRVTDLVMNSNDRATKAQMEAQAAAARTKQVEHANQVAIERLQICASHLNRYRKRCHAFELVLSVDRKHEGAKKGKLESMLRESLADLQSRHTKALEALRSEKRDRMINEVKRAMETQSMRKLQAQVAELEARGTATLRARDEAVQSLEGKLKHAEEAMFKWFKVELPRLVSGLPATEDALSSLYNENVNPNYGLDPSPYSSGASGGSSVPITNQLMSSLGMDRTYALAQALCASRASQAVHEMRISGLMEKLSVLKERNISLEGVLIRWKDEIQATHLAASVPSVEQLQTATMNPAGMDQYTARVPGAPAGAQGYAQVMGNANKVDAAIQQVYSYADTEAALNIKVHDLTNRLIELEELNIELKGKYEQANARAGEMKALVDVVMGDEQQLKTKATQQLTKIRLNLEQEHAEELRRLRQSYESEKNTLLGELESVAQAVEEAKLTTVDTTAWQRLVNGGNGDNGQGDLHYATQPRPTPIRNYVATPPYEEKHVARKHKNKSKKHSGEDLESTEEKKGEGLKKSKRTERRRSKSPARRQSSSSSDTSSSSSSSSSEGGSDSDRSKHGDRDHEDRGRGRTRRSRSPHARRGTKTEQAGNDRGAGNSGAYVSSSATEYARTLRKQSLAQRQPASGRDVMDVRFTPSSAGNDSNTSATSVSLSYLNQQQDLAEVQVENLERMLELERRRHAETKFEMSELQQLLDIQQAAFREHLNRDPPGLPAHIAPAAEGGTHKPSRHGAVPAKVAVDQDISLSSFNETISVASTSPPASERPEHARFKVPDVAALNFGATSRVNGPGLTRMAPAEITNHILQEVEREDPALWPALGSLLDELVSVLQAMSDRARDADDRLNVRTALAMAARVKVVCSSGPTTRNIPGQAAATNKGGVKGDSFHADQLFQELNKYGGNPGARVDEKRTSFFKSGSGSVGSGEARDHTAHLQSLANRVKMMEADFADDNIPERHLFLMRDLRMRVVELEKTLSEELQAQQSQWATERSALVRKADENALMAEQVKQGQSESMSTMRQRYEDALRSAEEALETNTSAAKSEVARLEQILAQQTAELREARAALVARPQVPVPARDASSSVSASSQPTAQAAHPPSTRAPTPPIPRAPTPPVLPPAPPAVQLESHLLAVPADNLNEFLRMQRLVSESNDHLDYARQQRQHAEAMHAREVSELKSHYSRYRRAQAEVVRSLEDQLEDLQEQLAEAHKSTTVGASSAGNSGYNAAQRGPTTRAAVEDSLAGGPSMATNLTSLPEAEDVIRKMEFKFKVKTAELEAVMRTLGRMATGEGDTLATQDQSSFNDSYSLDVPDLRPPHPQHGHHQQGSAGYGASSHAPSRASRETGFGIGMSQQRGDDFGVLANEHFDSVARDMQTEIYEARIVAGDKEIEALHRNLQKERSINAQLKEQLRRLSQEPQEHQVAASSQDRPLSAPKASAEPVLPASSGSVSAQSQSQPVQEPAKARLPTRRGSTGAIDRAGLDKLVTTNAIPTFAPSGAAAPSAAPVNTTTATAHTSSLTASTDPIFDFTQDYVVPEVNSDNEKTRLLVRRMNEMRRSARVEISRLKEEVTVLKNDDTKDEQGRPKEGTLAELRQQLTSLREENARKNKLVASLKSAKTAEDNALEQWKMEAGQLEENVKRLQRSVSSKDAMIKDLRSKVEHLENTIATAQREGVAPPTTSGSASSHTAPGLGSPAAFPMTDITNMPAQELRARLRSSEAERGRNRVRMQALKEKVGELEAELSRVAEENSKLKVMGERTEGLRATITRKDAMIHSLKAEVDKLQAKIDSLKTTEVQLNMEADKRAKQLQREVDLARRSQHELEHESQLMRERLTTKAEQSYFGAETRRASSTTTTTNSNDPPSGSGVATAYSNIADRLMSGQSNPSRSAPPPRPTAVQQRRAAAGTPTRGAGGRQAHLDVPSSLDSTKDDLEDVINALGVSPLHLGLGLNPRGSAMSDNYTHNASGRGSTMDRNNLMSPGEASTTSAGEEVSSVEKRLKALVSSALESPVKQRRL